MQKIKIPENYLWSTVKKESYFFLYRQSYFFLYNQPSLSITRNMLYFSLICTSYTFQLKSMENCCCWRDIQRCLAADDARWLVELVHNSTLSKRTIPKNQNMYEETSTFDQLLAKHTQLGNTRCDEDALKQSPDYFLGSAVHDTLQGQGLIERYQVYRKNDDEEITCIIHFGNKLNGHPGIVHGGIISTAIDNTFGWLFTALNYPPSFTANLNVNFR